MRYATVCSGIEAATVAWAPLGWEPVFFSEIDKAASRLLAHHYPNVPNRGDMTKFKDWPDDAIDVLAGGTPCQAFSVAGLRAGLADPRGNLTLTFLGVVAKYRPRIVVWENVPGVLSVDGGRAFGAFLGGLAKLGYGWAYRVLDAQHCRALGLPHAVPQRRRRVFVVGYLGDWRRAAAVLFDGAGLRGDSAPRREAGQIVAPSLAARTKGGGGLGTDFEVDGGLIPDVASTRPAGGNATGGERQPGTSAETAATMLIPEVANPLTARMVKGVSPTLDAGVPHSVGYGWRVRRLTPTECEKLMGMEPGYTQIPNGNKPTADGPRYKQLGNSWAANVPRVIGERIDMVEQK